MIKRRDLAGKGIGLLVCRRDGDGEAEMLRHRGHRGYDQQRIGRGRLHALLERAFYAAAMRVEHAEHVGNEEAIEQARLQGLGRIDPVIELAIAMRLIVGMPPCAHGRMADGRLLEAVEADQLLHGCQPVVASGRDGSAFHSSNEPS
ncbi:hypothetical protein NKJ67_03380 [Mesorhizobium sp. M0088]